MPYITPGDRHQIQMITLDSMLEPESEVRIIDAFVNALDLNKLGFARTVPAKEGRPAYDPRSLMKLYIYGVQNDIRSSRKERIRFTNKQACKRCPNRKKCHKGSKGFREVEFNKDEFAKANGNWLKAEGKAYHVQRNYRKKKKITVVSLIFRPDRRKMAMRMCLSEHPFGTIKRTMYGNYFLLRGKEKVEGEFALLALGYNIRRAYNHFGFKKLMDLISKKSDAFYSVFKVHLLKRHETPRIVYTTSKIGFFGILEYSL